ncbi:MAG: hypothetical protein GY696_09925, partial [Gammaproteobacteria bacterium]|nr:hypothetical protein [Gammaproteobacteria bacterium]
WAGQQSQGLFQRVTEAFEKYPPQKVFDLNFDDIAQEILLGTEPFPVLIASSSLLFYYTQKYCGLAVVYDDIKITEFDTLFMRKGLPGMKRITSAHRALIRAEFDRLKGMLYPVKSCYRQGLQSPNSYEPLELPQLQYVFGLVLAISSAGGMTLLAIEWLSGRLWNHPYVHKPEELGQLEEAKQELQKAQQLLENIGNAEVVELINAA